MRYVLIMKAYPNKRMLILGSICIVYWFGDFIFNALIPHHFSWLLWYSSVGLLGTGIALLTGNLALLYSLFCALFLPETIWAMDFLIALFFHQDIFGLIVYANILSLSKRYFYLTLYHFIIPIALFYGLYSSKKIYKYGWIGAGFFLSSIILLTAWLVSPKDQVNCLSSLTRCKTIF